MTGTHHAVPRYLTIMEVAQILAISPHLVQEHCVSGTFKSYQNEETSIRYVRSDTFKTSSLTWARFLEKHNEWLAVSAARLQTANPIAEKEIS